MKEPSEKKKFPSEGFGDYMKEIIISKNDGGQRADKFLMKYFSKAPKGFVYKMLRKKRIKLNGGRAEGSEMLAEGDRIQMYLSDETMEGFREERKVKQSLSDVEVVYEDENIIAVNKPAGLLSHAGGGDVKNDGGGKAGQRKQHVKPDAYLGGAHVHNINSFPLV